MELVSYFSEILIGPRLFIDLIKSINTCAMILDHQQELEVVVAPESNPTLEVKPHPNSSAQDQVQCFVTAWHIALSIE